MTQQPTYAQLAELVCQLESEMLAREETQRTLLQAVEQLQAALTLEIHQKEKLGAEKRELTHLTVTDWHTNLYNHRFMVSRCDYEFKRARRYHHPLSCAMIDIDHFKRVNDTLGHQFGDLVIRELGRLLKESSRAVDICGRYGGEEFMVLTTLTAAETFKYMSRFHETVEKHRFTSGKKSARVTVSIGIAEYYTEIPTPAELIARADKALYQAKEDGRNLLRIWTERHEGELMTLDHCGIAELKMQCLELSGRMKAAYIESTNALLKAIDARDHYTLRHSRQVAELACRTARVMGLAEADIEVINNASLLHDIGKIGIEERILVKREKLSKEEYEVLKKHAVIGINILRDVRFLQKEIPLILHHHERYDGSGYPHGLREREIPLGARIIAVADAFDAMTTDREFRAKRSREAACADLRQGCGTQFDPQAVAAFLTVAATLSAEGELPMER